MMLRLVPTLRSAAAASPLLKIALPKHTFVSPIRGREDMRFTGPSHIYEQEISIKAFLQIRNQQPYPYVIDIRTEEQRGVLPKAVQMSRKSYLTTS